MLTNAYGSVGRPGIAKAAPELDVRRSHRGDCLAHSAVFGEALVGAEKSFVLSPQSLDGEASHAPGTAGAGCSPIQMTEHPSTPRRLDLRGASAQEFPHLWNRGMRANQVGDGINALVQARGREPGDGVVVVGQQ